MHIQNKAAANKFSYFIFSDRNICILFYSSFLLINLVQAACTELFDDEAYYWVCSRFLDWGYFDHPPMIALLIRVGTFIFPSELGVRIFSVILCTASIYFLERLAEPENKKLFYAIILNILMLQIGGIVAAPDIPLFFFTGLFFISYKQFLEKAGFIQNNNNFIICYYCVDDLQQVSWNSCCYFFTVFKFQIA